MSREQFGPDETVIIPPSAGAERVIGETAGYEGVARERPLSRRWAGTVVDENVLPVRNRVQWGPIVAGAVTGLLAMLVLSVLGLAVGASAFDPGTDVTDWGTGAGIWGAITVLASFFLGGWVAAKTAAVDGPFPGLMNGLLAGATILLAIALMTGSGLANFGGFLGANLDEISGVVRDVADAAQTEAVAARYDDVEAGAWGTLIVLLLALGAAALGGLLGHHKRLELIAGSAAVE